MGIATTLSPNFIHIFYNKFGAVWVCGCAIWGVNGEDMCTIDTALRGTNVEDIGASHILKYLEPLFCHSKEGLDLRAYSH